jgi:hypothetical protein
LESLGTNRACPAALLNKLADFQQIGACIAVAGNPSTPVTVLSRLLERGCGIVHKMEEAFGRTYLHYFSPPVVLLLQRLAANQASPPEILEELLSVAGFRVREPVAANPGCPFAILNELSVATDSKTRRGVAANPVSPQELRRKLATDPEPGVRLELARNEHCDPSVVALLARDPEGSVRLAAVENEECPQAAVALLLTDNWHTVRLKALVHRACTVAMVLDAASRVCSSAFGREVTPILADLAHHPDFPPFLRTMIVHHKGGSSIGYQGLRRPDALCR